jgi:hypothetical protein
MSKMMRCALGRLDEYAHVAGPGLAAICRFARADEVIE